MARQSATYTSYHCTECDSQSAIRNREGGGKRPLSPAPASQRKSGIQEGRHWKGADSKGTAGRWWKNATFVGTFRTGSRSNAGERGLRSRSVYNEFEKVTEKGRFARHLPDGYPGQCRRDRAGRMGPERAEAGTQTTRAGPRSCTAAARRSPGPLLSADSGA